MKSYHNKNKRAVRLWLLLPFLLMASVVEAQVTVDVRIDSLELWVGEQTRITLDVSTDTKSKLGNATGESRRYADSRGRGG